MAGELELYATGTLTHVLGHDASGLPKRQAMADAAFIPAGSVVASATFAWTTHTIGTTAMAGGADTIPQITDGTEITSLSYTPKATTNLLRVTVTGALTSSVANNLWAGIFRDATANAKRATVVGSATAATITPFSLQFEEVAGSVSATTYRVRVGNITGTDTWAVNGTAAARRLGGSSALVIKIEEIKV